MTYHVLQDMRGTKKAPIRIIGDSHSLDNSVPFLITDACHYLSQVLH
jgi:hypothetical protein